MLPQFKGASFIYDRFIKENFKAHEDRIDAAMSSINPSVVLDAAAKVVSQGVAAVSADAATTKSNT